MIVIGADTHKRTHTLAAVDAGTSRVLAVRTVRADGEGMPDAWRWAHRLKLILERTLPLDRRMPATRPA
jgi:hypothetical protein